MNVGDVYGRLVVLELLPGGHNPKARVVCECGVEKVVQRGSLKSGHTRSCACLRRELTRERIREQLTTHGHAKRGAPSPEYRAWINAKTRTTNPNDPNWPNYGGRGITVSEIFANSFETFLAEVGLKPDPSLSLDRVDNERGYEPGNLRWATRLEQNANQRPQGAVK